MASGLLKWMFEASRASVGISPPRNLCRSCGASETREEASGRDNASDTQ